MTGEYRDWSVTTQSV